MSVNNINSGGCPNISIHTFNLKFNFKFQTQIAKPMTVYWPCQC